MIIIMMIIVINSLSKVDVPNSSSRMQNHPIELKDMDTA